VLSSRRRGFNPVGSTSAALAEHPKIAWAAATTGTTNLAASAVCRDVDALYEYLTGRVGILDGVQQVETAPVIRVIKRAEAVLPACTG
jgi:DNA-binding Lrp family transcriptional regulator